MTDDIVQRLRTGGKVELHLLKPVGQADCLCEHTYPADAVALIADACKHDERVRAQVGLLIEPLVNAVSIVADVWSRLPIEARMDIERAARSEEDAHHTMRRLVKGDDRE